MDTLVTMSSTTPHTKVESYKSIKEAGDDVSLRRKVAAEIAVNPTTTSELSDRFPEHSSNALRPRVNELIRMGCVERSGTRTNPSGHEAYVHHITAKGERYLAGEIEPEPNPPLSELKGEVVDIARSYLEGEATKDALETVVNDHDSAKIRREPNWVPPHTETVSEQSEGGLTEEERKQIENDPVLSVSDFE